MGGNNETKDCRESSPVAVCYLDMKLTFPTDLASILARIDQIDPIQYGKTRNRLDGAVTYLSPYISRGVISTRFVLERVLAKGYDVRDIESFVKELCWRDYFQRVGQEKDLNRDIRQPQHPVAHRELPVAALNAETGIDAIDHGIHQLYKIGYMHNHVRMYTAMLMCNVGQAHWRQPAQWLYYHLLDGDWASNACSWQWVAGANSSKKYIANQENINRFTNTSQWRTYLDTSYEALESIRIPDELRDTQSFLPATTLPSTSEWTVDPAKPTFIYNYYNLDPDWHQDVDGNRILLLEPDVFSRYPVSDACIRFMMDLSRNIADIQVFTGSFQSLVDSYGLDAVHYKEHPFNSGYVGIEEPRDWISDDATGYFPSFFAYWKQVSKRIY